MNTALFRFGLLSPNLRLFAAFFLAWSTALAAANPADAEFDRGVAAYAAKKFPEARTHFQKASDLGSIEAMANLGGMLADGVGGKRDYAQAFELTQRAASGGSAEAMYNLAYLYEQGNGVVQDTWEARAWYRKRSRRE